MNNRSSIDKQDFDLIDSYLKKEEKANIKSVTAKIYFRQSDDIVRFLRFKKQVDLAGITMNSALTSILRKYFEAKEQKQLFADLKNDLFYSFSKAMYARMAPFSNQIITKIKRQEILLNTIDKKLNVVLNALASNETFNKDKLENPSTSLLKESKYFSDLKLNIEHKINEQKVKRDKKVIELQKNQQKFEDYDFNNITDENDNNFVFENEVNINNDEDILEDGIYDK